MIQKTLDHIIQRKNRAEYWKLYQMREAERERQEKEKKEGQTTGNSPHGSGN